MSAARIFSFGVVLLPSACLGSADAHHSFRMYYDPDRSLELQEGRNVAQSVASPSPSPDSEGHGLCELATQNRTFSF